MRKVLTEEGAAMALRAIEGDDDARALVYGDAPGVTATADTPETLREVLQGLALCAATWQAQDLAAAALSRLAQTAEAHASLLRAMEGVWVGDPAQPVAWAQEADALAAAARRDLERLAQRRPCWGCDGCGAPTYLPAEIPAGVQGVGAVEVGRALHGAGLVIVPTGGLDDPAPQLCAGCRLPEISKKEADDE